jgi:hypothetical protein
MYRYSPLHSNHNPEFLGLFAVVGNGTEGISHATGISIATYPTIVACIWSQFMFSLWIFWGDSKLTIDVISPNEWVAGYRRISQRLPHTHLPHGGLAPGNPYHYVIIGEGTIYRKHKELSRDRCWWIWRHADKCLRSLPIGLGSSNQHLDDSQIAWHRSRSAFLVGVMAVAMVPGRLSRVQALVPLPSVASRL